MAFISSSERASVPRLLMAISSASGTLRSISATRGSSMPVTLGTVGLMPFFGSQPLPSTISYRSMSSLASTPEAIRSASSRLILPRITYCRDV